MWKEWSIIEGRLSKVYPFVLERRAIRAYVALSGHVRAVSVAHLSLLERENQGVTHCVTHPSFDRAGDQEALAQASPPVPLVRVRLHIKLHA
jgi:hypothetical protein